MKNPYCVQVIQNDPVKHLVSSSQVQVIKSLFNKNQIDITKYLFYQLDKDELGFHHVRCNQLVNHLKVFSADVLFHFNQNDSCYLISGNLIRSTGLDVKPTLNQNQVVEIFIQKIIQEKASMVDKNIVDGCFEIEFGYCISDDPNEKLVKAWKVKPKNKNHPYVYINDNDRSVIFYDNGVRFM